MSTARSRISICRRRRTDRPRDGGAQHRVRRRVACCGVHSDIAAQHRRATLIHNEKAGDRRHCRAGLVELLERAGYRVDYFSAKEYDIAEAVERPTDLVVAAGGDGTVAKIVAAATPKGPPIAILPLGTANNIARSLGIAGPLDDIVAVWAARKMRPFYPVTADGPWGSRRLAEGIGFGAIEQAMHQMPHKPGLKRARQAIRAAVLGAAPESLEIGIDGRRSPAGSRWSRSPRSR
jgi:diacylglycerol kinase (ATP)